jgi:hypothetical protein
MRQGLAAAAFGLQGTVENEGAAKKTSISGIFWRCSSQNGRLASRFYPGRHIDWMEPRVTGSCAGSVTWVRTRRQTTSQSYHASTP